MFGSSFNVEHADEQPFIHAMRDVTREALDRGTPFLGICFGAQVLAWTLGADIVKAPVREVGLRAAPSARPRRPATTSLAHYADGDMVFQWHMDTFALPDGRRRASRPATTWPTRRTGSGDAAWATQFHFEIDRAEIELWLGEVADTVEADWGKTPAQLLAEADRHQAAHEAKGAEVFRRFAKVAAARA